MGGTGEGGMAVGFGTAVAGGAVVGVGAGAAQPVSAQATISPRPTHKITIYRFRMCSSKCRLVWVTA